MNRPGCAPLNDFTSPTIPAGWSHPLTFYPSSLSVCFICSCTKAAPRFRRRRRGRGDDQTVISGRTSFRSAVANSFPPVEVGRAAAHVQRPFLQKAVELFRVDSRNTCLDCGFCCLFLCVVDYSELSFIQTTPLSVDINPTLDSTGLHLLCARCTHPRDATFLHASSMSRVPRWVRGSGV